MCQLLGQRSAGVLLHPTCLPSPHGIGDLGRGATRYVEWLAAAGVRWWQVLPLNPPGPGNSPYSAVSTFAGNTLLISPELLVEDGLLHDEELVSPTVLPDHLVDFAGARQWKTHLLRAAFARFRENPPAGMAEDFADFRDRHRHWLDDYCLFAALKAHFGGAPWFEWPEALAARSQADIDRWTDEHEAEVRFAGFTQFLFFRQWIRLKAHASHHGIRILGDLPIFVAYDSAEVWAHRELFLLEADGRPSVVAGVPPDYFSATGQLWGNPLYDWERMASDGYAWWISRMRGALETVDALRLDHFRGFAAYWEVPAHEDTAINGRWVQGPGRAFFDEVSAALGGLPFVAEDLGEITPDVVELRRQLALPGMAILHFAFSEHPRSSFIPYALERDLVIYTGTHDNNTTVGWFLEDADEQQRDFVRRYTGGEDSEVHWDLIRLALGAVADLAIVPHQDLAGLGGDCRMNTPAVGEGNWGFRITPWMLESAIRDRLAEMIHTYGRSSRGGQWAHREGAEPPGGSSSG